MTDKRALKILHQTYWSAGVWRPENERHLNDADFAYAKAAGVMFDPVVVEHDQVVTRLIAVRDALTKEAVVEAFLSSLSTRRLDLRSALGSYAVARHVSPHRARKSPSSFCKTCGMHLAKPIDMDLNVLNFERFKWGGVRHTDLEYAAFDLELFLREPKPRATPSDIEIFQSMIASIKAAPTKTTSAALQSVFAKTFKSNKAERDTVIAILGYCGILETAEHPGYRLEFVEADELEVPDRHFVDMPYPACWWTRADGLNPAALEDYFGSIVPAL